VGNSSNSLFNDLAPGEYILLVTDSNDCILTISDIEIEPSLAITNLVYSSYPAQCFDATGSILIDNIEGGILPFSSYFNNNLLLESGLYGLSAGTYTILVEDQQGCTYSAEILVGNDVQTNLVDIPNVFSPNSDGANDVWYVNVNCVNNYFCIILNRWGNTVYESSNHLEKWDGRDLSGNELTEGVYFYSINLNFYDSDKTHNFNGFVHKVK
jgi:gliding motility-associated-like protein